MWPLMGPRTVKFPKKGPHFSRFKDGKKGMKKRERKKRKEKEKEKNGEKWKNERRKRETSNY